MRVPLSMESLLQSGSTVIQAGVLEGDEHWKIVPPLRVEHVDNEEYGALVVKAISIVRDANGKTVWAHTTSRLFEHMAFSPLSVLEIVTTED